MLLSLISKLFASLLVPILFVGIIGLTVTQTLFSKPYIENQLQQANAYSKLADGINQEIAKNAAANSTVSESALKSQLTTIITADVLKQKINTTLDQLQLYFQGKGPLPTFDVSDLVTQAESIGITAPTDSNLTAPIPLKAASQGKSINNNLGVIKVVALTAAVLLLLGMLAIASLRRDFRPLAHVAITLGILLLILGVVLLVSPGLVNKVAKISKDSNPFASLGYDLARNIMQDIGKRFAAIGAVLSLIGIVARVLLGKLQRRNKSITKPYVASERAPVNPVDQPDPMPPQPPVTNFRKPDAPQQAKKPPRKIQL